MYVCLLVVNLVLPVVLRDHLLRHVLSVVGLLHSRQPKVADLQDAVAVHKEVPRLDVPM